MLAAAGHAGHVGVLEPLVHEAGDLTWESVLEEEESHLKARRHFCSAVDDGDCLPLSVAFSGGGVRAAAFQAGILWRLAESGLLQHVDYFCGVSGGGYITSAFASHVLQAGSPGKDDEMCAWYRDLVAKTLVRFQDNVGYLVRDPCWPSSRVFPGSGWCPRACDGLLLLLVTAYTILIRPTTTFFLGVVPVVEAAELFFGLAMRHSFCSVKVSSALDLIGLWAPTFVRVPSGGLGFWKFGHGLGLGGEFSPWDLCWAGLGVGYAAVFFLWCLKSVIPFKCPYLQEGRQTVPYLCVSSALAALARLVLLAMMFLTLVAAVLSAQLWEWSGHASLLQEKKRLCHQWVIGDGRNFPGNWSCTDFYPSSPWNGGDINARFAPSPTHISNSQGGTMAGSLTWAALSLWLLGVGASLVLAPFFPGLLTLVVFNAGPAIGAMLTGQFIQFRVFGALTGQCYWGSKVCWIKYDWLTRVFWFSYVLLFLVIPLYHMLHKPMHWYYSRSLRQAFFANGKDFTMGEMRENVYCPLFLHTATANDLRLPGDTSGFSEVFFTALHMGGERSGYIHMPHHQTLAKTVALGGAATDAQVLGKLDTVKWRMLLQALNLRMGDHLPFDVASDSCLERLLRRRLPARVAWEVATRLPSTALLMSGYALLFWAHLNSYGTPDPSCRAAKMCFLSGVAVVIALFVISFFGFSVACKNLTIAPGIRDIQMSSRFYHSALDRPAMLYLTDGGLQDCTGLVQLMHRKCKLIFLVIAFDDANDQLGQLRDAMNIATTAKLGCFYDPVEPERDVRITLDALPRSTETYMRLGIRYGWEVGLGGARYGELFIVKNRLPKEGWPWFDRSIPPFLSEDEVRGRASASLVDERWRRLLQTDLGGCCCNCCHFNFCNVAPSFPHISTGIQCLTPQQFNALCRLGHAVSREVAEAIQIRANPTSCGSRTV